MSSSLTAMGWGGGASEYSEYWEELVLLFGESGRRGVCASEYVAVSLDTL